MRNIVGTFGAIIATALAGALLHGGTALSQQTNPALEACAAMDDQAERLACYDAVLRVEAPAASATDPVPSERRPVSDMRSPPQAAPAAEHTVQDAVPTPIEALPESVAETHVRLANERRDAGAAFSVRVVNRVENLSGLSVFVADSGAIYEQVSPRRGNYPEPPFMAELEPASRSTYWLRTAAGGRTIRVTERDR